MTVAPDRRPLWIALLVAGTFFMEVLDGTVIATALPKMAKTFGMAPVDLSVGMSAYMLTLAVFIPASGWVADRYGTRRVFSAAIILFTLASGLCGMADDLGTFVVMRVLQGMGGALMVPVGRLAVLNATPKEKLISAIATITWPGLVAPVLGPPLGGFLADYASWRWIFYLNVPLGLAALICALRILPTGHGDDRRPLDRWGFVFSAAALLSLMYGIELIGHAAPPWGVIVSCFGLGVVMLVLATRHLRRTENPMIDLAALRLPTFRVTVVGGSLFRMSIGAVPFLLPLLFQVGFGLDAFHSGLLVLTVFAGNLVMKPATTPILRRFGFRPVLLVNGAINALALLACAVLTPETPVAVIVLVLFVGGMSRSMQFTAFNTIAFADVPKTNMSGANTLFSTAFQLSLGMGIALGAISVRAWGAMVGPLGLSEIAAVEFRAAFIPVAVVALLGLIDVARLAKDAGRHVSRGALKGQ